MANEVVSVEPLEESSSPQNIIPIGEQIAAEQRRQNGLSWLIFIVAFSVLNSVLTLAGISWAFFAGLGVTQVIDGIALLFIEESNTASPLSVKAIAFLLDLAMTGVLAFFVLLARRHNRWAYIGGMAIYILDAILLLVLQSWLTFAFHLYVLWHLWRGFQAMRQLRQWADAGRLATVEVATTPAPTTPQHNYPQPYNPRTLPIDWEHVRSQAIGLVVAFLLLSAVFYLFLAGPSLIP